jgi:S-adenosylmethionine-dependent methyltransferase
VSGDPFAGKAEWFDRGYRDSSHGRVRMELVLERLIEALPPPPAAVLDAGGGTGAFAIPLAERGYDVTVLDQSAEWLAVAGLRAQDEGVRLRLVESPVEEAAEVMAGERFDAVLCHTVLLYLDDPEAVLRMLRGLAREGAILSVLEKNREGLAMRPGLGGDHAEALRVLDDPLAAGRLGIVNRARSAGELRAQLLRSGWQARDWAGVRLFSDLVLTFEPDVHPRLRELERAASRRDPYRRVARFVHLRAVTLDDPSPSLEMVQARSLDGRRRPREAPGRSIARCGAPS